MRRTQLTIEQQQKEENERLAQRIKGLIREQKQMKLNGFKVDEKFHQIAELLKEKFEGGSQKMDDVMRDMKKVIDGWKERTMDFGPLEDEVDPEFDTIVANILTRADSEGQEIDNLGHVRKESRGQKTKKRNARKREEISENSLNKHHSIGSFKDDLDIISLNESEQEKMLNPFHNKEGPVAFDEYSIPSAEYDSQYDSSEDEIKTEIIQEFFPDKYEIIEN